jgi:CRP-like cAMP-binding protein
MTTAATLTEAIARHPFFRGMQPEHLTRLASGAKFAEFKSGDVLFREKEPASQFFLIEQGKVVLEARESPQRATPVQTLGPGDVLGWSWLFPPFTWHFQARAAAPTKVLVLNGAHLLVTAEDEPAFGFELMKRVAQIVIQRLQVTRDRLLALEIESALKG